VAPGQRGNRPSSRKCCSAASFCFSRTQRHPTDEAMTQRERDPDGPREPIRVTPATGRNPFLPTAGSAAQASDAATARLVAVMHELNNLLDGATRTLTLAQRSLRELAIAPGLDP